MKLSDHRLDGKWGSRLLRTYEFLSPAIAEARAKRVRWLAPHLGLNVSVGILPGFDNHVVITCSADDSQKVREKLLPILKADGFRKRLHPTAVEAFIEFHDQIGGFSLQLPQSQIEKHPSTTS